jgi:glutamine synthetase
MRNSAEALKVIADSKANTFLTKLGIYSENELNMRFNVRVERYCLQRIIEFNTLISLVHKDIFPATIQYKALLANAVDEQKDVGVDAKVDKALLTQINNELNELYDKTRLLMKEVDKLGHEISDAEVIANKLLPLSEEIADHIAYLEEHVSEELWPLPTYFDLLFVR